ncbi:hypothetical protein [Actinoplanes sp. RD1]|uniref:hypothetical protein n=1 Tax=Actinoplanes sp. RD1 TaxID=3064538 RepID=UPI0027409A30|nr:hypothetical protein [Actinoplanes sp. RD1]
MATSALRTEATEWDHQSRAMSTISTAVAAMELGRLEAGLFQLIVAPYNDLVAAVTARAAEGSAAMTQIGQTLRTVADTYDAEDKAGEHRIRNVY